MSEKEMKKIDEKNEEEVSGGKRVKVLGGKMRKIPFPLLAYGAVSPHYSDINKFLIKDAQKIKKFEKPKDALITSKLQTEDAKMEEQK